jgi:hypothetical protein
MVVSSISDFLPFVLPEVPGCPEDYALFQLKNSARQFFDETWAWRKTLDPIPVVNGQDSYDLDPDVDIADDPEVRIITSVRIDNQELDLRSYSLEPMGIDPFHQITFTEGHAPTSGTLVVGVALVPRPNTDIIPAEFLNRYFEGIRTTALYNLLSMPNNKWYHRDAAERYRKASVREEVAARRDNVTQQHDASIRGDGRDWI